MNFLWVTLLFSFLHSVRPAPAISSVHVSFVSGNKATEYSHAIGGSSPLVHYNLVRNPEGKRDETGENNLRRKRSISLRSTTSSSTVNPTHEPLSIASTTTRVTPTTTSYKIYKKQKYHSRPPISAKFGRKHYTKLTTIRDEPVSSTTAITINDSDPTSTTQSPLLKRMLRPQVKFLETRPTAAGVDENTVTISESSPLSDARSTTTTSDNLKGESTKPKDSKAVKRSPYIGDNFETGGIQFPDFDEFGGEEFGSLRNFAGGRGGGHRGGIAQSNPEGLSPNGVFLPPLPTEASDYADSDPYLADPDTAKYAAQHPPFFAAFPHKRTVLALNEQRVHNGLEPNFLRSIRPYFAFFDAANPHTQGYNYIHKAPYRHHGADFHHGLGHAPHPPGLASRRPPPPISYSHSEPSSSDLFGDRNPNHLLYAESDILRTQPDLTLWSIFSKKK